MKVKELKTYQTVRLSGSLGEMNFINTKNEKQANWEVTFVPELGVIEVKYKYNSSSGILATDTLYIPMTNVAYFKKADEIKIVKEAKAK